MSPIRVLFALASVAGVAVAPAIVGPTDVYQESGGMVVMEAENTPSSLGTGSDRWELYTPGETNYVDGATGGAHLEFQGNYPNGATTPKTPLTYKFKINEAGTYQLHIRSRARLAGAADDKNNDCYVKLTGLNGSTFDDGPNAGGSHMDDAIKSLLTSSTKIYVNSPTSWGWANLLDAGGSSNKRWPVYQFPAGGSYELSLGGRSGKYNFDRIIFRKVSIPDTAAKSTAIPESALNSSGSTSPAIARVMLVNADTDDDAGILSHGGTINLAPLGPNLNLRADTTPAVIGSVRFTLDGAEIRNETQTPYSIGGDNIWDDYLPWTPTAGSHTLTVTPYSVTGAAGTPVTVNFTVTNQAVAGSPVANAGVDKTITLPSTTVSLSGSGTDSGGSIAGYKWDQVSGPMPVAWSSSIAASPTLSDLAHGTYKFRLTVTDNSGLSGYDDMTVTVLPAANSPVVNAGVDKTVTLPATAVTLNGTGTDPRNSIYAYLWTQLSGPSNATRAGESSLNLTASNLIAGTYVFRLRIYSEVSDVVLVGADDVVVNVTAATGAPVANAGVDKAITLPTNSVTLNGSGTDTGGSISSHAWTQVSGPGTAGLSGNASANLTASALIAGSYVFRLTVTDNSGLTASDDAVVTVTAAASNPPVANAGADKAITLPTSSVTFNGSGTDTGGSITGYAWTQVSGPGTAGLSGNTSANLTASALVAGSYVFRLTVTDNSALTASDDVTVVVSAPGSGAPVANAGADKTVTLPTSSVVLSGSGTDSGGSISSYAWTQVSGPNTATRGGAATATLTASGLVQGGYVFRLTVTDNSGLTASDDVIVTVNPAAGSSGQVLTTLMLVNADTDQELGPMTTGMSIDLAVTPNISVRADTSPAPVGSVRFSFNDTVNLRTESGPPYTINGDVNQSDYLAWPIALGTHTLTGTPFTQAAGAGSAGTPLTVVFNVINSATSGIPVANAGADKTIVQPAASVVLNGSATDADGSISSHLWTQVSGPGAAALSGSATANLTASNLVQGTYLFRYRATDNAGNSASDEASVFVLPDSGGEALLSGELKKWHKVTLSFRGPVTSETATPNPFTDYRLNVTFSHPSSGKSYVVPGYFAADGNAANSSAGSGNIWRAHFAPDETGLWVYTASFRSGSNLATTAGSTAGASAGYFDDDTGNFNIAATDKSGVDFRGKGRLEYVGKHHLRFAETGEYFMKAGVDAPENLLAYSDFDGEFKSDGQGDAFLKTWGPHAGDWQSGDPSWGDGKGKGLIGAINYLAAEGLNAFSFLTFNVGGDDKNVFPYTTYSERSRMDVSKLDQWEMVFEHGTEKGMHMNFKTQETENELTLDGGDTGNQRKLYYREMIARFGHHPGLNWNLGEEINDASSTQKKAWAQYFHDNDPYKHPIVIHNGSNHYDMLGSASKLTGFSLQLNASDFTDMFSMTKDYIDRSEDAGRPWVVACDEPGDSRLALRTDADPGSSHTDARKNAIWGNIMAGGAGVEFYFGYDTAHSDLTCQDFRSRDSFWDYCRHAREFMEGNGIPFEQMSNRNSLVSGYGNNANRCLAKTGHTYLVQLHGGGTHTLNLSGTSGSYTVRWFNPRSGGALINGPTVNGGGTVSLGAPPNPTTQDWIALVRSTTAGGATNTAPVVNAGPDSSGFLSGGTAQVLLSGSVTDDGLPDPLALTRSWSFVSGPAAVAFSSPTTASTTATFTVLGSYVLKFTASDSLLSASDQVTVTVQPPVGNNRPPVFSGYSTSTPANNALTLSYSLMLGGASDPDGDALSPVIASGSSAAGGYVAMASGMLTYTPPPDFSGSDSFALTIQDGRGGSATGSLVITVQPEDGVTGLAPPVIERIEGNQHRVRFHGVPGVQYSYQRSEDLVRWTTLQTLTAGATGVVEFTDSTPPSGNGYYRLTAP
ncbi:tandem-95 repeat protein [Luteolibacter sp. Populi]|uniref:PKD domain-containing protein n=1 Tax=Luteolibacter sp. Populi TaxID=3230487 RepID=UPI0034666AC4